MVHIKLGGRKLALDFTLAAMDEMEAALGKPVELDNLKENVVDELRCHRKLIGITIALARQGAMAEGKELDIDGAWLSRKLKPARLVQLQAEVLQALTEGMTMETEESDEDGEVDVVLEEIKKNDAAEA